ncbi:TPA: hypothetical protein N0F65_008098 [Lagenidium giganteum]|uniref:Saposin B-type domain-containing protein n=1 Tax=Lagenidium giganteum TaxID=4803 RepID=A0AAV2Z190_9STRA|nr:TPA: hypothetical protein N0F65_008098 [Lagenidium giganteum]
MRTPRYWLLPAATTALLSSPAWAAADAAQEAQATDFWATSSQFINRQLERSNQAFQRLFDSILRDSTAPVQIVVLTDAHEATGDRLDAQERFLACGTALQRLHEMDELKEQEDRITARLRSSVQHALKLVSLHYVDETRCEDLESAKLVKECKRVLNMEDEVRLFLAQGQSDKAVCEQLYSTKVERLPLVIDDAVNATDPQPLSCKLCKRFVQMVDMSIQKDMQQLEQIREIINDICDSMAQDSKCRVFVQEFDQIVKWLKDGSDPDFVCKMIKMCSATEEPSPLALADGVGDDSHACFYCEHITAVIGFVNQHAPDQVAKLRTVIKYVCKLSPKDCQCDKMEKNFDKIADWVKSGKQPQEICENLGICKKGEKATVEQNKFLDALEGLLKLSLTPADGAKGEDDCIYCDYFTTMLESFIKEKPEEIDEIRELADTICGLLGDDNQCHQYVSKLDLIVDGLKAGKDSKQICAEIGFCPKLAAKGLEAMNQTLVRQFNQTMNKSVDNCFFCTQLTSIVKVSIDENPDQINEIRQIADMICNMLPDDNKCHPVMKEFDQIVDSIRKGEDPHAICQDLGVCPKSEEPITLATPVVEKTKGTPTCAYCEGIVMVLEIAIKQRPDDVNEMREAAGVVCEILPKDDQCHQQLKMFDEAVEMLKKGEQPHEICNQLKFCTEKLGATQLKVADLAFLDKSLAPSKCNTCKQNALLLASLVTSPDSLDTFTRQMDSICRLVPESNECKLLLDHYDSIVEGLKKNENVEAICKRIDQCTDDAAAYEETKSMSVGCLFCEYTAELLSRTGQDATEMRYAKEALETMCFILPPDAKCDVLVSKFDELAGMVHHGQSPSVACNKLGLCAKEFVGVEAITAETKPRMEAVDALMAIQ